MKKITFYLPLLSILFTSVLFAQPGNNICSGAETLSVGILGSCSYTLVTIDNTVTDSGVTNPGCANYQGSDLWYQVVIPASGGVRIETSSSDNSIDDTGLSVYSGTDCNNLTLINCNDDISGTNTFSKIDVVASQDDVIFVRVWEWGGSSGTGSFNICASEINPPPPAVNDDCITAETLVLGATCNTVIGSNNATNSEDFDATLPGAGCASYAGRDVWYKVVVPASGKVIIETYENDLSITDGGMAVYTGSCDPNGLTILNCDDGSNLNTIYDFERIEFTDREEGEELFIRVWSFDNNELGTFQICAIDPESLSNTEEITRFEFKMYPNPIENNSKLNFKLNNTTFSSFELLVFNIHGKFIFKQNFAELNANLAMDINVPSSGVYFVKILSENSAITKKLIVK